MSALESLANTSESHIKCSPRGCAKAQAPSQDVSWSSMLREPCQTWRTPRVISTRNLSAFSAVHRSDTEFWLNAEAQLIAKQIIRANLKDDASWVTRPKFRISIEKKASLSFCKLNLCRYSKKLACSRASQHPSIFSTTITHSSVK